MPAPILLADIEPLPRVDAWRVLQVAAVVTFFAAWLFVIAHAGLLLAAEWRLAGILRETNEFARLPKVNSRELADVVRQEVQAAGLGTPRLLIAPGEQPGGPPHVAAIEVSADQALPAWIRHIAPRVTRPLRAVE